MIDPARPRAVRVFEVGPRDGLQNEALLVPLEQKLQFVGKLVAAGLRDIEVGAFVHPRWVPQMADTEELVRRLPPSDGVRYWVLVPNERGLDRALAAGAEHFGLLASASETHSLKNINRSVQVVRAENRRVAARALAAGATLRGYVSVAFGCPYEGAVPFDHVLALAEEYLEMGVAEVALGDTTGMAGPDEIRRAARRALRAFGAERIAFHLHDTRGTGLVHALAALEEGVTTLDSSTGGIGGCPYAPGAAGNLATEDLLYLLQRLGIESGVALGRIVAASRWLCDELGLAIPSRYFRYAMAEQ
ncbi:MAG: hydroxymethylglutaryl-CoA lyase [Acidobacteria bacterium]|jgi:hydroxymethylglutaryl-CoA lyase|nr:hydroxymethylglutaryl-CoA lyase [Acidobacteriota bacterium]